MGQAFQVDYWATHPSVGVYFGYYGQRKLAKAMEKGLKAKNIFATVIYENKGK